MPPFPRIFILKPPIRVGNCVVNAHDAELRAESQLTRRYWRFLDEVSKSLLILVRAASEAEALAVSQAFFSFSCYQRGRDCLHAYVAPSPRA